MVLSDIELKRMLDQIIKDPDYNLVNPASIDIRIGDTIIVESPSGGMDRELSIANTTKEYPYHVTPGEFILVSTLEHTTVPNGYVAELKLKSSAARAGFNHALAFWVDPGWSGILTMELKNWTMYTTLKIWRGQRIAQLVVHKLDQPAEFPYQGKYQGASGVEGTKI